MTTYGIVTASSIKLLPLDQWACEYVPSTDDSDFYFFLILALMF